MYCKFCGNPIDRNTMACVSCGKPVGPLSGGNSFKNVFLGEQSEHPAQETPERNDQQIAQMASDIQFLKKKASEKRSNAAAILAALGLLACLAVLVFMLMLNGDSKQTMDTLKEESGEQASVILQEIAGLKAMLVCGPAMEEEAPAFEYPKIHVHVNSTLPSGGTGDVFICSCTGTVEVLQYTWLRYDPEEKDWIEIREDDPGYMIRSSSDGGSYLGIKDAGEQHEGTYYCEALAPNGEKLCSSPIVFTLDTGEPADPPAEETNPQEDGNPQEDAEPQEDADQSLDHPGNNI